MSSPSNNLVYIHSASVQSKKTGGLNSTLLQVFSMCTAYVKCGFEVILILQRSKGHEENLDYFLKNSYPSGINFKITCWTKKSNNLTINKIRTRKSIVDLITTLKPDIIISREPFVLSSLSRFGVPLVYESHNARLHTRYSLVHLIFLFRLLRLTKKNSFVCLFSISAALSKYWAEKGVPKDKLLSWHDGFDSKLFLHKSLDYNIRNILNIPEDKVVIMYSGGLYPDREIWRVIDIAKKFCRAHFVIIGGPENFKIDLANKALIQGVDNITFTGFVEHSKIPAYLFSADILLGLWSWKVPTMRYCSPLKLFEYMASGKLIVAHDFPTIREVLNDGEDAILFEPDSTPALEAAIEKGIALFEMNIFGKKAQEKAYKLYTWDRRAQELKNFITKSRNNFLQ